jgi:CheY-like chemotaxis protein
MPQSASSRPVVLIVEDEVLLRWQTVAIVEDAGFDVVEAATVDEAVAILEAADAMRACSPIFEYPAQSMGCGFPNGWDSMAARKTRCHVR